MSALATAFATEKGEALHFDGHLVVKECPMCAIPYALPQSLDARNLRDDNRSWYCPNGHSLSYTETEVMRLRDQIERERGNTAHYQDRYNEEKRSHTATKGSLTKAKRRASGGVCPHCNRTFKQVRRHITKKHPANQLTVERHADAPA